MLRHLAFDPIIDGLVARGYAVINDFISAELCMQLRTEMHALRESAAFRPAGIGRGSEQTTNKQVRSDLIHWLGADAPDLSAAQRAALSQLDALRLELNRTLYLGLREFEAHLAVYPAGAFYAKHVDQHQSSDARVVSFVLYLNDSWTEADAGHLRLYDKENPAQIVTDVLPRGGTLACFLARDVPHEVLPPARPRYSLTGWMRR